MMMLRIHTLLSFYVFQLGALVALKLDEVWSASVAF